MDPFRRHKIRWGSPQRIGLCMIFVAIVWIIYLLSETHLRFKSGINESDYLKTEIIKLSRKYIHALAKEKNNKEVGSTNTQQTAVLLTNMLDRIEVLEDQLHGVMVNSTKSFETMNEVINVLNITIHKEKNSSEPTYKIECHVPTDPGYPQCASKVEWMETQWKSDPKFKDSGVNGSRCSFLEYLSSVEDHCPKNFMTKREVIAISKDITQSEKKCLNNSNDHAFPNCQKKIEWMKKFWQSDPMYASHGVDGSICSIVKFLSEIEDWCPLLEGRYAEPTQCVIPKVSQYPHCGDKVAWMRKFWKSDSCYERYGVNGTVCSFISYLGEVERWCPLYPGRSVRQTVQNNSFFTEKPNLQKSSLEAFLEFLKRYQSQIKVEWMSRRITRLWSHWVTSRDKLAERVHLDSYKRKKILIYIGLLADEKVYHFAEQATKGGPLGELVQWSDIIVSLYLLGHNIVLSLDKFAASTYALENVMKKSSTGLCPSQQKGDFDIIYTDYIGLSHMIRKYKNINHIKCHLRIVDSFGTEAQYNYKISNVKNLYGFHSLNLKQYCTMFPHSSDNTFLGFVVDNHLIDPVEKVKKKPIALVYGKHISMWKDPQKISFLNTVQEHFEVHATVGIPSEQGKVHYVLPSYVKNHGVLQGAEYQKLLREATLFVGIGFPYEGPAPLEAIANGCFFLNAKLIPPLGRSNDKFFKQKPTERKLTSQHPYAETFIGKPYVYTVDLNNKDELKKALEEIEEAEIDPYLPFEYTYEGMLERLYALTKHHDFCDRYGQTNDTWPPLSAKQVYTGEANQNCDQVCSSHGTICEPAFFQSINKENSFEDSCPTVTKESLVAPAIMTTEKAECMLQGNPYYYSCTANSPSSKRICPCRDFVKGQTALCKDCLDGLR